MTLRYNRSAQRFVLTDATMRLGSVLARYGLVSVIAWFGAMKFTSYEARGIQPLIAHSPFCRGGDDVGELRVFPRLGVFPFELLPLAPSLRRGVTAHILVPYGRTGAGSSARPPLRGWFHGFGLQDWLDLLALLASGTGHPGR